MKHFADRLFDAIEQKNSCVVVGLDPNLDSFPPDLQERARRSTSEAAAAILEFNRKVIEAVSAHAVAVKPQSAFYEALGWEGVRAYAETVAAARENGLLVIGDVKRGDIGSTAEAYAQGHLDFMGCDAVTVNPYLGTDSIAPFLKRADDGKGVFVLVKTSNPSSNEVQDLEVEGERLYEKVASLVNKWGAACLGGSGYSAVGAVVGATYPAAAEKLRKLMPRAVFLVPGYGAQGAGAEDCRPCFDSKGLGAIVNSSRGIIYSWKSQGVNAAQDWPEAVARAAEKMKHELQRVRLRPSG